MKSSVSELEQWRSAVYTLADGPFFDLIRGYLGDIKTPFNKQRLVAELESFLAQRDVQATITALLDAKDRRLLTAIDCLGEPSVEALTSFLADDFDYSELRASLLNLEERLLIYRRAVDGRWVLALNPGLEAVLKPVISDHSGLFPSWPRTAAAVMPATIVLDDARAAAVLAFLTTRSELLKHDGRLKKRVLDSATTVFSSLDSRSFTAAFDSLRTLGLIRSRPREAASGEAGAWIDEARLTAFAQLSSTERRYYYAAALSAVYLGLTTSSGDPANTKDFDQALNYQPRGQPKTKGSRSKWPYINSRQRERTAEWARFFRLSLSRISAEHEYSDDTIIRILELTRHELAAQKGRPLDSFNTYPFGGTKPDFYRQLILALTETGLLERSCQGRLGLSRPKPPPVRPTVGFEAAFTVFSYPELDFTEVIALSQFLNLQEVGTLSRWELSRDSAVRAFNQGFEPANLVARLETLAGQSLPELFSWSLNDWFERYRALTLYRGSVLVIAERLRYLVDTPAVAALIAKTLAPGVFLLTAEADESILAVLAKAGAEIVALPQTVLGSSSSVAAARLPPFPALKISPIKPVIPEPVLSTAETPDKAFKVLESPLSKPPVIEPSLPLNGQDRLRALRQALAAKKLPKDRHEELMARIDRRMILTESQLSGAAVRYEKLEASGLDYFGKVRAVEQALTLGSLLELHWRGSQGEPLLALGQPQALDKHDGEMKLVIIEEPSGRRLALPLAKISLIRRLKRSIFGE